MERFKKQISERFAITGDFSHNMVVDEEIVSATVTARVEGTPEDNTEATATIIAPNTTVMAGQQVQVVVFGGVKLANYIITWKVTTDAGWNWELDVKMQIKET